MLIRGLKVAWFLAFASVIAATAARAQNEATNWVVLYVTSVEATGTQTLMFPNNSQRTTAIRLAVLGGSVSFTRVVITYGNGQVHFENRPGKSTINLAPGERTKPLDQRDESRIVESVAVTFEQSSAAARSVAIEVWGLRAPSVGTPTSTATPPGVRPRGADAGLATNPAPTRGYVEVPTFFGTTRQRETDRNKNGRVLATFSGEQGPALVLGRSIVTVPTTGRNPGSIPRPPGLDLIFTRIVFRKEDPNRDFTIAAVDVMNKGEFVIEMGKQVEVSSRFKGQALVFVHGYNVSFDDAIFRTAQISHDIGFDGPAVSFSWASRGGTLDYIHDINTAKASRDDLRSLLETIATETGVSAINLVAHSMGNDPVLEVLKEQAEVVSKRGVTKDFKLNEVVLAAPDVSRNVFEQLAGRITSLIKGGITLYASRNDLAMIASMQASRGVVRAGDVPKQGIVVVPGVESIDISDASTSLFSLNHSTFADRAHLISDLTLLFERTSNKHPPHVRFAVYRSEGSQPKQWWRYRKN